MVNVRIKKIFIEIFKINCIWPQFDRKHSIISQCLRALFTDPPLYILKQISTVSLVASSGFRVTTLLSVYLDFLLIHWCCDVLITNYGPAEMFWKRRSTLKFWGEPLFQLNHSEILVEWIVPQAMLPDCINIPIHVHVGHVTQYCKVL